MNNDDRVGLSHTMRSRVFGCERKALLGGLMRLRSSREKPALRMGTLFDQMATGRLTIAEMEKIYNDRIDESGDYEEWKEAVVLRALFRLYKKAYPDFETEESNLRFEHSILSPSGKEHHRVKAVGEIDGMDIIRSRWVMIERKTTGLTIEQRVANIPRDNQLRGYVLGAESFGRKVREISYRVVRKPRLRQKKHEDWATFLVRVEAAIDADAESYCGTATMKIDERFTIGFKMHLWEAARRFNDLLMRGRDLWVGDVARMPKPTGKYLSAGFGISGATMVNEAHNGTPSGQGIAVSSFERLAEKYPQNTDRCGDYGGCDFLPICANAFKIDPFTEFDCLSSMNPELENV